MNYQSSNYRDPTVLLLHTSTGLQLFGGRREGWRLIILVRYFEGGSDRRPFVSQASSVEVKERWVKAIRNALMMQFDEVKGMQAILYGEIYPTSISIIFAIFDS